MKAPSLLAILVPGLFGLGLAACDPTGPDGDALVGSWLRTRDTGEIRDRYTFSADGSFAFDENKPDQPDAEDHLTGTYTAANGIVTATATNTLSPGQVQLTFSYYAGPTQFASGALLPEGAHTGIVGVWTGIKRLDRLDDTSVGPEGSNAEFELRTDGTYRSTITAFDGSPATVRSGTWTQDGDMFLLTDQSGALHHVFSLLDGTAVIDYGHVWQRN